MPVFENDKTTSFLNLLVFLLCFSLVLAMEIIVHNKTSRDALQKDRFLDFKI